MSVGDSIFDSRDHRGLSLGKLKVVSEGSTVRVGPNKEGFVVALFEYDINGRLADQRISVSQ